MAMSNEPNKKSPLQEETDRRDRAEATRTSYRSLNQNGRTLEEAVERHDAAEAARVHYRLLSRNDLRDLGIRYSRVHLARLEKLGKFPRSVPLGENRRAWVESEVIAFIKSRIAERDAGMDAA
jgi:prophage regulatory protein